MALNILQRFHGQSSQLHNFHCIKTVRIQSYSCPHFSPHFPAFGLNTERYSVPISILSECSKMREKMRTRITPNKVSFYAVFIFALKKNSTDQESFTAMSTFCHSWPVRKVIASTPKCSDREFSEPRKRILQMLKKCFWWVKKSVIKSEDVNAYAL